MNGRLVSAFILGIAMGTATMPVLAITCYEIIDRNDVVVLRDTRTPVDLSNAGAAAREAMRSRGEYLIIFDVPTCVALGRAAATGSRTLNTEEIVAGWRSMEGKSGWGTYSGSFGGPPTPVQNPTQAP